ncbi:ZNRF2 (predicted) [Pycnogonum litorale]
MGAKQSTNNNDDPNTGASSRTQSFAAGISPSGDGPGATASFGVLRTASSAVGDGSSSTRQRARSLINVPNGHQPIGIPGSSGISGQYGMPGSPESDSSTPDDGGGIGIGAFGRGVFAIHSLPAQLLSFNGIKCPVCNKFVLPDDIECHLVMCLTKPRINYNEDVLSEDKGECVICLDDLQQGDTIARLPCLCIYHKSCIDSWFEVNRSCPEHPTD